jgi:biotin carboxyl carrier protein
MRLVFEQSGRAYEIELIQSGDSYRAVIGDRGLDLEIVRAGNGRLDLLVDGTQVRAFINSQGAKRWVTVNGRTYQLTKSSGTRRAGASAGAQNTLLAPMPGQVRAVHVAIGDQVSTGQTLLLLEAMKMEIRVQAPRDGVVKRLTVAQGQTVEREQVLLEIGD